MSGNGRAFFLHSHYTLLFTTVLVTHCKGNSCDCILSLIQLSFEPRPLIRGKKKSFITMKQKEHYVSMHFEPCTISTFSVFAVFSLHQSTGRCFILTTANSLPEKKLNFESLGALYFHSPFFFSCLGTKRKCRHSYIPLEPWQVFCSSKETTDWNDTNRNLYHLYVMLMKKHWDKKTEANRPDEQVKCLQGQL